MNATGAPAPLNDVSNGGTFFYKASKEIFTSKEIFIDPPTNIDYNVQRKLFIL